MTRLTRYVTLELLPPLLAGTLLFTAILSFGYFFISSQWLQGVPVALVGQWIAYQVPDTLVKVLPMAVVLMTVVAFGRMSTERELVAVQSGGISLGRVARPAGVVALLVTALSVWLSLWVAPRLNVETRGLYWDVLTGAGLSQLSGKTVDLGDGVTLFMRGYDATTRELQGVRLERWESGNTRLGTLTFADRATFENRVLTLRDYRMFRVDFGAAARLPGAAQNPLTLPGTVAQSFPAIRSGGTLRVDTGLSRTETLATYADAVGADAQGWPELMASLTKPGVKAAERDTARVTLNRKLALPFANLVLALAALPFALRYGRTLGVALGLALLLAVAYYLLFFLGLTLAPLLPALPEVGVWLANVVFAALGLTLLRRA